MRWPTTGCTLDSDERLLADVLAGNVSSVQLAEAICSPGRMGLPEVPQAGTGRR
jgi:hypothetical protein